MRDDTTDLRRRIAAALKAEQWAEALPMLEQWCKQHPKEVRGWFNRAYCLLRVARLEEAKRCIEHCLRVDPSFEKATRLLAHLQKQIAARPVAPQSARATSAAGTSAAAPPSKPRATSPPRAPAPRVPAPARGEDAVPTKVRSASPRRDGERVWQKGTVVGGRYEVRRVARGGMGVVYMAFDRELERMVAVKTPLPSALATDDGRARFFREAEAWVALGIHPNICTAFYVQEIGGLPRLFIEHVDGGDLQLWLLGERELGLDQRLDIAIQIARGMHHTHTLAWTDDAGAEHRGLIHRDLKPANVLMSKEGTARVTDFGLVRAESGAEALSDVGDRAAGDLRDRLGAAARDMALDAELSNSWQTVTVAGGVLGTPPYVAPEMWKTAAPASTASDIYAFGCMLYEILCGRRAFVLEEKLQGAGREKKLIAWMKNHVKTAPPNPGSFTPELDGALRRLMVICLAKDPQQRPTSFAELRDQLTDAYVRHVGSRYPRPQPYATQLLADSLNNSGVSFFTLGHAVRGERAWREALAADPRHREATFNLAIHEWHSRGLSDAEVLRRMEEVGRGRQSGWRDHHLMGKLHLFLDRRRAAVKALLGAAHDAAASVDLHRDLGLALIGVARSSGEAGPSAEAEAAFRRVLGISSSDLVATVGVAAAQWLEGRREEAQKIWARACETWDHLSGTCEQAFREHLPGFQGRLSLRLGADVVSLALTNAETLVCRVTGGRINTWSMATGESIGSFDIPDAKRGRAITVRGNRLVASGEGLSLAAWDLSSGRRLEHCTTQPGHVISVAVSADGTRALTGGSDRVLRLWDLTAGTCLNAIHGHDAFVSAAAFAEMSGMVVSADGSGRIRLFDQSTGECLTTLSGHAGQVLAVLPVSDDKLVVSAGEDGTVRVWNLDSGAMLRTLRGHRGRVSTIAASADGALLLSGGADGTLRMWDLAHGVALQVMRFDQRISEIQLTADDETAVVGHGMFVDLVDIAAWRHRRRPLALTVPITAGEMEERQRRFEEQLQEAEAAFAAGDLRAAVATLAEARALAGYDHHPSALRLLGKLLTVCSRATLRSIAETGRVEVGEAGVTLAAFTADRGSAVVASGGGPLVVVSLDDTETLARLEGHSAEVTSVAVSPDGSRVAAAIRDGTIHQWDLPRARTIGATSVHDGTATAVAFSARSDHWLSAGSDGKVVMGPVAGDEPPRTLGEHDESVACLVTSRDGRYAVSGGWDQVVMLWELARGLRLRVFEGHTGVVSAVDISPDCRRIASGGGDGAIRIWDVDSGRLVRTLTEGEVEVTCVAFSPDARFLLSGSRDGTVQVWDLRAAASLRTIEAHVAAVSSVGVSPDSGRALSAGADGRLRLWRLDWEPGVRETELWDDRARPYLEVFLRLHSDPRRDDGRPVWHAAEVDGLMSDLAHRGFGRLGRAEVEQQLARIAGGWGEQRSAEDREVERQHRVESRRRRRAPLSRLSSLLTHNLGLKLAGAAVLVIAAVFAVQSLKTPADTTAVFNSNLFYALKATHDSEAAIRKTPGLVFAYHGEPAVIDSIAPPSCAQADRHRHLDVIVTPERHASVAQDPAAMSRDPVFLQKYQKAMICLPLVADAAVVDALLQALRNELPEPRLQDVVTVLVRSGAAAVPALDEALANPNFQVRQTAAWALAEIRSDASLGSLADAISGDRPATAAAASTVLQEVITGGVLSEERAFELIRSLCSSIDPELRRNAVFALALFSDTGPVKELFETALEDPDAEVRNAARSIREQVHEARRKELFGG